MFELPYEIRKMLAAWPGAMATAIEVNGLAAIIVKAERADTDSAHRPGVPVAFQSQLGQYPAGAVIRLYVEVRDRPAAPLKFETFLNPAGAWDYALLRKLAGQETLDLHFFDMRLRYQYTKRIPFREVARRELAALLDLALAHNEAIPAAARDFGKARDQMMAEMPL